MTDQRVTRTQLDSAWDWIRRMESINPPVRTPHPEPPAPRFAVGDSIEHDGYKLVITACRPADFMLYAYCIDCTAADRTSRREVYQDVMLADSDGKFAGIRPRPPVRDKRLDCC